jgi:hypothetical protein
MEETEKLDELKKLTNIATDMELSVEMRRKAIDMLENIGTHEALLVLLNLAANDKLNVPERERALKRARNIIKSGR